MKQGWEIKKLGEVCTIERGGSPRPIQAYITESDDGINWIKIGDATDGSKYITSTTEKIKPEGMKKSRFVHKGDFILSTSMSFGRPYILAVDGCIHDGWLVIHDDSNRFDKNYLYYYLGSPNIYNEFKRLAVGGVVNNLNSELVRSVNVCIPPRAEQERIMAELDCLSGMIEKKREQLRELDALAQSIFYTMFGDPNNCIYETRNLSDLSEHKLSYGSGASAVDFDGKIRYVRITDIKDDGELQGDKVSPNVFDDKYTLNDGDILFARSGATVGKTYQYRQKDGKAIYAGYLIRFIPNRNIVLPSYIFGYTKTNYYKAFISASAQVVAQPNINAQQYGALKVPIPPLTLQQEFADKIEAIEKQKALIKQSITQTEELFNARMAYYFN